MKDQQDMLKHKEYQYFLKKQEEKRQKSEEIEYLNKRIEQDNQREKKYSNFYKKIQENQSILENLYSQQVSPKFIEKEKSMNN